MKITSKRIFFSLIILLMATAVYFIIDGKDSVYRKDDWRSDFLNPPAKFRPQPFWHINGELTTQGIRERLRDAYWKDGFGGVAVLPLSPEKSWTTGEMTPGTLPEYMTPAYFERYGDILQYSTEQKAEVILYDDINFPSGTAWKRIREEYPQLTKKLLGKQERDLKGPARITQTMPQGEGFLGVVAMNTATLERLDLSDCLADSLLTWEVPAGDWKLMAFYLEDAGSPKIDYMDSTAVATFISLSYDRYAEHFGHYFGNTIQKTFFDDVGIYSDQRYWNPRIGELFRQRYGQPAVLFYPALWYDIGPETGAARTALFGLRAELMGEGFPKQVAAWCQRHGLSSMGHPPGNYEPTAVDMYGDPFWFYRYTQIPLMDAIHGYPFGRSGFKLISSAAEAFGRPVTAAECYGNYAPDMDSQMLYRVAMELMARGINFLVPHGMWYDESQVKIPPLISHGNPLLGAALHAYSDYVGRAVSLLQGGRRVADIALLYPIESLEAWYAFDTGRPDTGKDVPPGTDYNLLSDWLTGQLRLDFTFVHPGLLQSDLYSVRHGKLHLDAQQTGQQYQVLIMPSQQVLSAGALAKIKAFYEDGGKIVATGELPTRSAEFGRDAEVTGLIRDIFGIDPTAPKPARETHSSNARGGEAIFLPTATPEALASALGRVLPAPDVRMPALTNMKAPHDPQGQPLGVDRKYLPAPEELGMFSYIHKQKDGRDIYLFANSTNRPVDTWIELKGKHRLDRWNPHTGEITPWAEAEQLNYKSGDRYTRIHLQLDPVQSVFAISR